MSKRVFTKEEMMDIFYSQPMLKNEPVEQSRWLTYWEIVFEYEGRYWTTTYSAGSTEIVEARPFEYDPDEIECYEVEKRAVIKEEWVPVGREPEPIIVFLEKNGNKALTRTMRMFTSNEFFALDPDDFKWDSSLRGNAFFYTAQINSLDSLKLLSKVRLEKEFSKYANTKMYQYIINREWRR